MIQYWHKSETLPPPWIRYAPHCNTRAMAEGRTFGIGDGLFLSAPPTDAVELEHGWKCWQNKDGPQPEFLARKVQWLATETAFDMYGREWQVPIVLDRNGRRAFRVAYDREWKPFLTAQQVSLINWAEEACIYLQACAKDGRIMDPAPGCAWASRFLEVANHITGEVIGKLNLMDDIIMISTLRLATSSVDDHA